MKLYKQPLVWIALGIFALTGISTFAAKKILSESEVDPLELEYGIAREFVSSPNLSEARAKALVNLTNDPRYYSKLISLGL